MNNENLDKYQEAYHTSFQFYDENQWYLKHYANFMVKTIVENKLSNVLSLGIGHNVVSDSLLGLVGNEISNYQIIEGSADIITDFRKKNDLNKVEIHNCYFENFESNDKFDAIEMGFVLEHVDDPEIVVRRFKELLSEDGVMFISVPNAKSLHRMIGHKAGLLNDVYELSQYDRELGHKRYFDLESLELLVSNSGLKLIRKKGLMLKPITGQQMKDLKWRKNIIDALFEIGNDYPEIANCLYVEAQK